MQKITAESFLSILLANEKFANYIINNYPEIEADIRSYRNDSKCSCKKKITSYYQKNEAIILNSIQTWINDNKTDFSSFVIPTTPENARNVLKPTLPASYHSKYKDVIGEIVEIAPDPNEYKRIIAIAREEWLYNGINILETVKFDPQTKTESVVWLLLFY